MFKKVMTALLTGIVSGAAVAAGGWVWKNCLESRVNELKQEYDQQRNDSLQGEC